MWLPVSFLWDNKTTDPFWCESNMKRGQAHHKTLSQTYYRFQRGIQTIHFLIYFRKQGLQFVWKDFLISYCLQNNFYILFL